MTAPLVSIVTPVLNGARFLPDCLESVRHQSHPRLEHIVVDGGSTDGTLDLLASAKGVRWVSEPDAGMYAAINRGLGLARGEVLAYQNADDRYAHPEVVSRVVSCLLRNPGWDLVWGRFRLIDAQGRRLPRATALDPPARYESLKRYNFIPPHATFVRARVVRESGLWLDASLQFAGDWDWFVRMLRAGKTFGFIDEILADFRVHPDSKTATFPLPQKLLEWRRICRSNGLSFSLLLWHEFAYVPLLRRLRSLRSAGSRTRH